MAMSPKRITVSTAGVAKMIRQLGDDKVRFNLTSGASGYGSLELYNTLGQKIAVVYQGYVQAGRQVNKDYLIPKGQRNTLIYVFKVGEQQVTGKLMGLK